MMAQWERVSAGETLTMCGMCQAYTDAWDETIKMENIPFMNGEIGLTTSSNSETVAKLQKIAERSTKEMMEMMAAKAGHGGEGHEGHNH